METTNPLSPINLVPEFLKRHSGKKYTAQQMAEEGVNTYPEQAEKKKGRAWYRDQLGHAETVRQIGSEIGRDRKKIQNRHPEIRIIEGRPLTYYWTEKSDQDEVDEAERTGDGADPQTAGASHVESDLYPFLSEYLLPALNVYSMRINERRSHNRLGPGGNKWLHPDLAGMEDLISGWHDEIKKVHGNYGDKKARLWSFEVKILLNRSNVRTAFFQAVSNSSWANLGYLVAKVIEGAETMDELRMLSSLHGIGFIQIDTNEPVESQILIPARERNEVDWATCNRLAEENVDFLRFITNVREFYQTGNPHPEKWDFQLDE